MRLQTESVLALRVFSRKGVVFTINQIHQFLDAANRANALRDGKIERERLGLASNMIFRVQPDGNLVTLRSCG